MNKNRINKRGFTLIEILVVIGIIAVLSTIVIVAINPARQFKLARDSQRTANVTAILNAVGQNMAENKGVFTCNVSLPNVSEVISSDTAGGGIDIAACISPLYISTLPYDPSLPGARFVNFTDYDTQYLIKQDLDGRVTVSAAGEIQGAITISR
jgi:prepilin-type N-terminal cleavage/methylation domain-containing protein